MTRFADAGKSPSRLAARVGRAVSVPPQLGQTPEKIDSEHSAQNVHSKEQIIAPGASAGRSVSQRSQFGRISNTQPISSTARSRMMSAARQPTAMAGPLVFPETRDGMIEQSVSAIDLKRERGHFPIVLNRNNDIAAATPGR